jgi:putative peptidoglycan lipid II flippase
MLLTVPSAVALAVVPHQIVSVLFERGAFHAEDTRNVANALALFALGLPSFVMIKVFSPAYFAREDTRTPMRYAVISLTSNTVGSIVLFWLFGWLGYMPHLGIAVATTLGGWLNAALLYRTLAERGHFIADARLQRTLPMILLSSALMGIVLWLTADWLAPWLMPTQGAMTRGTALAILVGIGLLVYAVAILATGALGLRQLRGFLWRAPRA